MQEDLGKLVLRVTVGGLLLFHGMHKLLTGIAGIKAMVVAHGMPDALAYGVYLGEIVGPILVLLGVYARIGAGLIVINMILALVLSGANLMGLNAMGGYQIELEAFYLLGALSVALLGPGRLSLGGGRWN